ncbi:MAG TPA: PorV/PorQ family protein [Fibrobacter sp.]|nr:PorV/PorQ family protein [Fibrobacter sp.]
MRRNFALLIFLFSVSLAFAGDYWNVDPGGTTMKFLSMSVSPRAAAIAGAGVAAPAGISEVSRNPLATSTIREASIGINEVLFPESVGANLTSIYFGLPLTKVNVSAGLEFLGYREIEGRDEDGFETGSYGAFSWAWQLGVANKKSLFNWALSLRMASQTIEDETSLAILGDVGGSFAVNRFFSFGATLTNVGYASPYMTESETPPTALQAGIAAVIPILSIFDFMLYADAYRRADTESQWLFGGELSYKSTLVLRSGYSLRPDTESGLSAGIGICFDLFSVDYAYQSRPAIKGNHLLSLTVRF